MCPHDLNARTIIVIFDLSYLRLDFTIKQMQTTIYSE